MRKLICKDVIEKELSEIRDGVSVLERIVNEPKIMERYQRPLWKDVLSAGAAAASAHESKKLTGHVTVDKPNNKIDSMDMKVHLTLKSNKKHTRSHSLTRQKERKKEHERCSKAEKPSSRSNSEYLSRERDCKRWSEILRSGEVPLKHKNPRRSRSTSVDRESPFDPKHENCHGQGGIADDVDAFSLFNPVRSLQFLMSELHNIVKPQGDRVHAIFDMVDVLLNKLPPSPVSQAKTATIHSDKVDTPKLSSQISRSAFEIMRKERDSFQNQLSDKSKSHLYLERKVATLEATLVRVKSEREELRGVNHKLNAEQRSLILALNAKSQEEPSQNFSAQLAEELKLAQECIVKLQATVIHTERQFRIKMKEVQGILHDGFDFSKNDSVRLSDVLGQPPGETSVSEFLNYSVPQARPQSPVVRLISPEPPPFSSTTSPSDPQLQQCINNLMKQSGTFTEEQLNLFQSFVSIPDLQSENLNLIS